MNQHARCTRRMAARSGWALITALLLMTIMLASA